MLELARANNPSARFERMDIRNISSIKERFDGIFVGFCMPYLKTPDALVLVKDATALLSPGGVLALSYIEGDPKTSGLQTSQAGHQTYHHFHRRAARAPFQCKKPLRIKLLGNENV